MKKSKKKFDFDKVNQHIDIILLDYQNSMDPNWADTSRKMFASDAFNNIPFLVETIKYLIVRVDRSERAHGKRRLENLRKIEQLKIEFAVQNQAGCEKQNDL